MVLIAIVSCSDIDMGMDIGNLERGDAVLCGVAGATRSPKSTAQVVWRHASKQMRRAQRIIPAAARLKRNAPYGR
jgi:hypothetical protein